jgi:CMP-2-keto-3-deoxyoctulosonic acid synthetase
MLSMFSTLTRGEFEKRENVEMFRYIENGYKVKMVEVNDIGLSVDTPNDIKLVEGYLNGRD